MTIKAYVNGTKIAEWESSVPMTSNFLPRAKEILSEKYPVVMANTDSGSIHGEGSVINFVKQAGTLG